MAAYFILHWQVHGLDKLRQYQAGACSTLVEAGAEVVLRIRTCCGRMGTLPRSSALRG